MADVKNPPAFPRAAFSNSGAYNNSEQDGMTLLDYFAGQVLPSISDCYAPEYAAERAYNYAEAMLKERKKRNVKPIQ